MKTVILHAGLSKTGTSYLQSSFAKNHEQLAQSGIAYPRDATFGQAMQNQITSGNGRQLARWLGPAADHARLGASFLDDLLVEIETCPQETILYSSEFLSLFEPSRMTHLVQQLAQRQVEVRCVAYYRSVLGDAWSNYCQVVKRHLYVASFTDYLEQGDYPFSMFGFVERVQQAFDKSAVTLRCYDDVSRDLFGDFLEHMLPLNITAFGGEGDQSVINRSLTAYEIELLRQINRSLSTYQHSCMVSDSMLYQSPERSTSPQITRAHLEFLQATSASKLAVINEYLGPEQQMDWLAPHEQLVEERVCELSEFESATVGIMAKLVTELCDTRAVIASQAKTLAALSAGSPTGWRALLPWSGRKS